MQHSQKRNPSTYPLHKVFYTNVPTVDEVLASCGFYSSTGTPAGPIRLLDWNGCMIPADDLRAALEDAYDPAMPNWPAMVQLNA